MPKRRRQVEEQFYVEVIKQARVSSDADWEYYVKWGGYTSDDNSWEPAANLQSCERLLKSFWANIGLDDNVYEPGYTVEPTKEWIEEEVALFNESSPEKLSKKKKKEYKASTAAGSSTPVSASATSSTSKQSVGKVKKQKAKPKKPGWVWATSSDGEAPLPKSTKKSSRKEPQLSPIELDSDGEAPLPISARKTSRKKPQLSPFDIESDESDAPLAQSRPATTKVLRAASQRKDDAKLKNASSMEAKRTRDHDSLFSSPSSPAVLLDEQEELHVPIPHAPSPQPSASTPRSPSPRHADAKGPARQEARSNPLQLSIRVPPVGPLYPTPSATIASTPGTASASGPKAPSHKERQQKSKVQMIPMQLVDKTGATSIPTKQKIAQLSGTNTSKPSTPLSASFLSSEVLFPPQKSFSKLSFKKKSVSTTPTPTVPSPVVSSAPAKQQHKPAGSSYFPDKDIADSPVTASGGRGDSLGWDVPSSANTWDSIGGAFGVTSRSGSEPQSPMILTSNTAPLTRRPPPSIPRQSNIQPPQPKQASEAERFLSTIMPPELAAPMDESADVEPQRSKTSLADTLAKKVPVFKLSVAKKWNWTGELYMETGPDKADKLCNVCLSEPTEPRPLGLTMNIIYNSEVSILRLKKFHDIPDLYMLLRACAPLQQCCRVSNAAGGDAVAIKALGDELTRNRQFTYANVYLDNDRVGLLVIFPPAITEICTLFRVPDYLSAQSTLLAALVPWSLTADEYVNNTSLQPLDNIRMTGQLDPDLQKVLSTNRQTLRLLQRPLFAQGLRIHKFTVEIYDFLTRSPRSYCMWHSPPEGKLDDSKYETSLLVAVLDACGAKNKGYKSDVRVIFVHVGALSTLGKLPALAMRKCKQQDMRIYSFGTHSTVPPNRWGLREIYPIGGIVTFTPAALLEDPLGIYKLIKMVDQHPLWMCYVHPYVLAALFKQDYANSDPVAVVERGEFIYLDLLKLIENGTLSLLYAPPVTRAPRLEKNRTNIMLDPHVQWAEWVFKVQFSERTEILAECVRMFEVAFPNALHKDIKAIVEKEVLGDMARMQLQPDMMDNHRRFVAVMDARNELELDGVELTTAQHFNFRDDWSYRASVA
ncbi:hypothetical protein BC835DRAFT_1320860 [Cytidiella melzeri]|nr:hypothetical protein BC835DRAFT_1320860 [Cytidiella melzeri]